MRSERYHRERRLYRSPDGIILGVCAGIADYYDMPPWAVRILFIILCMAVVSLPLMVIIYIVLGLTMKMRPDGRMERGYARGGAGASREEAVGLLRRRFESLDQRLQRLESIVTKPTFGLEDEYRNL